MSNRTKSTRSTPQDAALRYTRGYIAPTRSEAENDPAKFYELITYVNATRGLTWGKIGKQLEINESNVSRRINGRSFDPDERKLILDYIFDESGLIIDPLANRIHEIRDSLYFALLGFYDVKPTSQDNTRAHTAGTYQLWRRSVEHEGHYVFGRIDIFEDENSHALRVKMKQPHKAHGRTRASNEEYSGYFFRVADMYVTMLRDEANNDLRITIFPRHRIEKIGTNYNPDSVFKGSVKHVVHMEGHGLGIDGNSLFSTPVYMELVDDKNALASLADQLDVVPEDKAPPLVVAKLKKFPHVVR